MGYTHYWNTVSADDRTWERFTADVKKIVTLAEAEGIRIKDGMGKGDTYVSNDLRLVLNGDAETDQDYETFAIDRFDPGFNFCKTQYRPYDVVVIAILLRGMQRSTKVVREVSSDGRLPEWAAGIMLYKRVFGRWPVAFPNGVLINAEYMEYNPKGALRDLEEMPAEIYKVAVEKWGMEDFLGRGVDSEVWNGLEVNILPTDE